MFKHIAIAIDGSELSTKAVASGAGLAKALGAKLSLIWVAEPYSPQLLAVTPYPFVPAINSEEFEKRTGAIAAQLFADATGVARLNGVSEVQCQRATDMHPYQGILDTCSSIQADLLVMASHGRRGLGAVLLGSETQKVLTHSTIPVLVVR